MLYDFVHYKINHSNTVGRCPKSTLELSSPNGSRAFDKFWYFPQKVIDLKTGKHSDQASILNPSFEECTRRNSLTILILNCTFKWVYQFKEIKLETSYFFTLLQPKNRFPYLLCQKWSQYSITTFWTLNSDFFYFSTHSFKKVNTKTFGKKEIFDQNGGWFL